MIHPPWIACRDFFRSACRIGQDKPVFVHKLLCQDTVEQRIHQMLQQTNADITNKLSPEMVRALLE